MAYIQCFLSLQVVQRKMFSEIVIFLAVATGIVVAGQTWHLVYNRNKRASEKKHGPPAKTLIILGSGGHTMEILQILKHLSFDKYSPRVYACAYTDKTSTGKVHLVETVTDGKFSIRQISRSREVGQSYLSSIPTSLVSLRDSMNFLWREKFDVILCNGPGTCVPICVTAFIMNLVLFRETKIIFIESFCRVKTFSLSGKILYYLADLIIVRWPHLCTTKDKRVRLIK